MIPQINYAVAVLEQPSTKKKLRFRPYVVKEERILLMAKENNSFLEVLRAVKQILQNCCLERDFNASKITLFDLEYLFLKLRAVSVNNVVRFSSLDKEDNKNYKHAINLDDVKVLFPENMPSSKIEISKDLVIMMKYPTVDFIEDKELTTENLEEMGIDSLLVNCMDKVFEKDRVLKLTESEKKELLDNLSIKSFDEMKEFLFAVPKIEYRVYWKNSLDKNKFWLFSSLKDFFLFL